jgi:hypothetical protein
MKYWNVGMSALAEGDLLYMYVTDKKINSDQHPLFMPNIPFFHHSIIPWAI